MACCVTLKNDYSRQTQTQTRRRRTYTDTGILVHTLAQHEASEFIIGTLLWAVDYRKSLYLAQPILIRHTHTHTLVCQCAFVSGSDITTESMDYVP